MSKKGLPDWMIYWEKSSDLKKLREKSNNLDETLRGIESEFGCKLLSGDHMQIISALEDRIDDLESSQSGKESGVQADLFEA